MALDTNSIIVIPDIHGRTFWKDIIGKYNNCEIIFLGDYFDPYSEEKISYQDTLENFIEILSYYENNKERVTLLLGNHDMGYIDSNICSARRDYLNYEKISNLLVKNILYFKIVKQKETNGKHFVFSHAGFNRKWIIDNKSFFEESTTSFLRDGKLKDNGINFEEINSILHQPKESKETQWLLHILSYYSKYRGYSPYFNGSPIWADIREYIANEDTIFSNYIQIVGHTQLVSKPIKIDNNIVCLDVRRCFMIDKDGIIREMNDLKEI